MRKKSKPSDGVPDRSLRLALVAAMSEQGIRPPIAWKQLQKRFPSDVDSDEGDGDDDVTLFNARLGAT